MNIQIIGLNPTHDINHYCLDVHKYNHQHFLVIDVVYMFGQFVV